MTYINHVHYANMQGNVYCCLRNKIVPLNESQIKDYCQGCTMFRGGEAGKSVQCYWNDVRDVQDPHEVYEPQMEFKSMQKRKFLLEPQNERNKSALA
ncbi:hypothetical protein ACFQ88_35195 [Paenibacillus sp. NPDC056579]|uniref:hypothetical protein n=1 Tax=unclassified Paenibacillus TaxID=185978 RepID=UPI001EF9B18F|nr:hypothetical protein [Paenibacillus sp. H1-7]ULL18204.1 hypothetical protein DVH26_29310 [Paenibacillus sp. H1-7]